MRIQSLGLIGLLDGVGGAINAWLCYAELPVPVGKNAGDLLFPWHVVPTGAGHGAILALSSVALASQLRRKAIWIRLLVAPLAGWLAGYMSWSSLNLSLGLGWNHVVAPTLDLLWWPFRYFGLVGGVYYLALVFCPERVARRLLLQVLLGATAGTVGSLWWWLSYKPWYFSLIHGTIWGALVGFGVWHATRRLQPLTSHGRD